MIEELMEHLHKLQGGGIKSMMDEDKKSKMMSDGEGAIKDHDPKHGVVEIESIEVDGKPKPKFSNEEPDPSMVKGDGHEMEKNLMDADKESDPMKPYKNDDGSDDEDLKSLMKKYMG